ADGRADKASRHFVRGRARPAKAPADAYIAPEGILLGYGHLPPVDQGYVLESRFSEPALHLVGRVSVGIPRREAISCRVNRALICISLDGGIAQSLKPIGGPIRKGQQREKHLRGQRGGPAA